MSAQKVTPDVSKKAIRKAKKPKSSVHMSKRSLKEEFVRITASSECKDICTPVIETKEENLDAAILVQPREEDNTTKKNRRLPRRGKLKPQSSIRKTTLQPLPRDLFSLLGKTLLTYLRPFMGLQFNRIIPILNRVNRNLVYSLNVDLSRGYTSSKIMPLLSANPTLHVTNLNLKATDTVGLSYLEPHLNRLSKLRIAMNDTYSLFDLNFLRRCESLKKLELQCNLLSIAVLTSLTTLTHLTIESSPNSQEQPLNFTPLTFLRNLRVISLDVRGQKVSHLIQNLPFLEEVTFTQYQGEIPSFEGCPHLRSLSVTSTKSNVGFISLDPAILLETLVIREVHYLYIEPAFTIPFLQSLTLEQINSVDGKLRFIKDCTNLKYIELRRMSHESKEGLDITVLTTLPRLTTLILNTFVLNLNLLVHMQALDVFDLAISNYYGRVNVVLPSPKGIYMGITNLSITHDGKGSIFLSKDYLASCPNLVSLKLGTNVIVEMAGIRPFSKLESLEATVLEGEDLSFLSNCPELKELDLKSHKLTFSHLNRCTKLTALTVYGSTFTSLQGIGVLPSLTILKLIGTLKSTTGIEEAINLRLLSLECSNFTDFVVATPLPCFRGLFLREAKKLRTIEGLRNCPNTVKVELMCSNLEDLTPIEDLQYLRYLTITNNNSIRALPKLSTCPRLFKVELYSNSVSYDITGLQNCDSLVTLNIRKDDLLNVNPLSKCINLEKLYLENTRLKDLSPLTQCPNLSKLTIINDNELADVSPLSKCVYLTHLRLKKLDNLQWIRGLNLCPRLYHLDLTGCDNIDDSSDFLLENKVLVCLVVNRVKYNMLNPERKQYIIQKLMDLTQCE